jgi:adenylate cyclase
MANPANCAAYQFGSFSLDLERGALRLTGGQEMALRPKSFALLRFMVENPGRLVSRDVIMNTLWPNVFVTEDNITQCIHDIRGALGTDSHQILRTVPRRGYLFTSEVVRVPLVDPPSPSPAGQLEPASQPLLSPGAGERAAEGPAPASPRNPGGDLPRTSVMVARLRNLGVPAEHEYLVESITEDLSTDLPQYLGPVVVACPDWRNATSADLRQSAREFGVAYVIQGSIRGVDDRLALNLQLIDVESDIHVWSERFDFDLAGQRHPRNEMTNRVTFTLLLKIIENASRRIEALPAGQCTPDDLVTRGYALLLLPMTAESSPDLAREAALENFATALRAAPDLITAKLGIAQVLLMNISDGRSSPGGLDELRTEQLLADVLRVDGQNGRAHSLLGVLRGQQGRFNDALVEHQVAMELAPNHPWVVAGLGIALVLVGRPNAGLPLLERSLRLSPYDFYAPVAHGCLALCHMMLGNTDLAIPPLMIARAMNPRIFFIHLWIAGALGLKGDLDEAGAALRQGMALMPEFPPAMMAPRFNPEFMALYIPTVYAGLLRAGMPDILAD